MPNRMPSASSAAPVPGKAPRSFHVSAILLLSHSSRRAHGPLAMPCSRTFRTTSRHLTNHSGGVVKRMKAYGVRSYIPEKKQKGRRNWAGKAEEQTSGVCEPAAGAG